MKHLSRARWFILIAMLALAGCPDKEREAKSANPPTQTGLAEKPPISAEQPSHRQPVARGLRGLAFGMTPAQTREVLGVAELDSNSSDLTLLLITKYHSTDNLKTREELPGEAYWVETRLGTQPAACRLEFMVDGGLSRMACQLGGVDSREIFETLRMRVHQTLVRKYGPAQESTGDQPSEYAPVGSEVLDRTWVWQDHAARLELRTDFIAFMPGSSRIELLNASARHLEAVERYHQMEKRRQEAAEAEARHKHEEQLQKLEQKGQDAFARDL